MRWPALFLLAFFCTGVAQAQSRPPAKSPPKKIPVSRPVLDHSGEARRGKASFYGKQFYGRKMADGTPMNPRSNVAASRTLPLGTKAVVENLANGRTEVVEIKDRGPYIEGRIIDLSPQVADKLGMLEHGVVPVEVRPVEVPQPDGSVRPGVAAMGDAQLATSE